MFVCFRGVWFGLVSEFVSVALWRCGAAGSQPPRWFCNAAINSLQLGATRRGALQRRTIVSWPSTGASPTAGTTCGRKQTNKQTNRTATASAAGSGDMGEPSPGADVGRGEPGPGADVGRGEPSLSWRRCGRVGFRPGAAVGGHSGASPPGPGADALPAGEGATWYSTSMCDRDERSFSPLSAVTRRSDAAATYLPVRA